MNIGILSTASIVPRFIEAFRENDEGSILAVASRNAEKAAAFAAKWQIPKSYGSYDALLRDPDIGAVYIAMISAEHYRWAMRALEHGKHVLCEKPFTLKKSEASDLFRFAGEKGLFIAEMQKAVFLPVMQEVKSLIEAGPDCPVGRIQMADFSSSFPGSYNSWLGSAEAGGGAIYSNGGYTAALSQYFFGKKPDAFTGLYTKGHSTADEQCAFSLRFDQVRFGDQASGDVLVTARVSNNVPMPNRAVLYGGKGRIEIPDFWKARQAFIYAADDSLLQEIRYPCRHELIYEIRHYLSCIEEGLLQSPVMNEAVTVSTAGILERLAGA